MRRQRSSSYSIRLQMRWINRLILSLTTYIIVIVTPSSVDALRVVLAGGTGPIGQGVAARCDKANHDVVILARNSFLASAPARVTQDFGWVGQGFLTKHCNVRLRDWDGGDLLDIVGQDWVGWQEDVLKGANVVVHLVGGFTEQRVMACERLVRESLTCNRDALHVTVAPTLQDLELLSPGMTKLKNDRIVKCEEMVKANCANHMCLRIEANRVEQGCDEIFAAIGGWTKG
ncbi:hypothetical protein MPSEU_000032800 [Mayamaea pseudoterrestris]|nr:hypothetical protein MPSEU_000032800 [Mayamaea pseudoterrestris]